MKVVMKVEEVARHGAIEKKPCPDPAIGEATSSEDDSDDEFLALPPRKSKKTRFPPGIPVTVRCKWEGEPPKDSRGRALVLSKVRCGKVTEVGINLKDGGNRENLYRVKLLDQSSVVLAQEKDLLPLEMAKFPRGCPVLVCCKWDGELLPKDPRAKLLVLSNVLCGEVTEVGSNLSEDGNQETIYQLKLSDGKTSIMVPEKDLQFAVGATVWIKTTEGIIIGSEHLPVFATNHKLESKTTLPLSGLCYSVQTLTGSCKIYNGVRPENILYRQTTGER